jgi:hypothetical protein
VSSVSSVSSVSNVSNVSVTRMERGARMPEQRSHRFRKAWKLLVCALGFVCFTLVGPNSEIREMRGARAQWVSSRSLLAGSLALVVVVIVVVEVVVVEVRGGASVRRAASSYRHKPTEAEERAKVGAQDHTNATQSGIHSFSQSFSQLQLRRRKQEKQVWRSPTVD